MNESRKIFSTVMFAMRTSFRKCGSRRLVGPAHGGIQEDFLNCETTFDWLIASTIKAGLQVKIIVKFKQ